MVEMPGWCTLLSDQSIQPVKDYNLYYYYLEVATDASAEEIDAVFASESKRLKKIIEQDWEAVRKGSTFTGPPHKWEEHLSHITEAHSVLMNPETRAAYHNETYPSSPFAESIRKSLSIVQRASENGCWPPSYVPRRHGPTPTSYEEASGCVLFLVGFMLVVAVIAAT
jgi:hypothetical protein